MPARSNDFQAVVYFIKRHIAADAEVKESAMLPDLHTGEVREVDVCVTANVGGDQVLIGIECRDHRRKADVSWVDSMYGKHQRLPTHKLVLVSKAGFSKGALAAAQRLNIECVRPGQPPAADGPLGTLAVREVEGREIEWRSPVQLLAWVEGHPEHEVALRQDHVLFAEDGTALCNVAAVVNDTKNRLDQRYVAELPEGDGFLVGDHDELRVNGHRVHLRVQGEGAPELHRLVRLRFVWPMKVTIRAFRMDHGELQGTEYVTGTGPMMGHDAVVVITDGPDGGTMSLRLTDSDGRVTDLELDRDTQEIRPPDEGPD